MSGACALGKLLLLQLFGLRLESNANSQFLFLLFRNVQVTLGILAALVEKSPKEAALIAPTVLKVLDLILRSGDITMIESSIPTFEAFCENHDPSSLFGDKDYLAQYESVVRSYAQLASTRQAHGKGTVSRSLGLRWRNAGLSAIKCVSAADALSSLSGRQIDVIVPMILENLWSDNENYLDIISERAQLEEKLDAEKTLRRRTSVATVRTNEEEGDANPIAISGTALDVDNMAEEETGVLAVQCLKSIFVVPNRSQIHAATGAVLKFVSQRKSQGVEPILHDPSTDNDAGWAVQIFNIMARWAPVQDRYIIPIVILDTMLRTPLKEDTLEPQILLSAIFGSMLRSDVNLIGLSVMDVLVGLIRQIERLLKLRSDSGRSGSASDEKDVDGCRPKRHDLLHKLEKCIGDLATHVYYADQVWDMLTAILVRLKPSRPSNVTSPQQVDRLEGEMATDETNGQASDLGDNQTSHADTFLPYTAGRASALRAIKAILLVANPERKVSGDVNLSRNRVPLQVWEGTQWLLQDPSGNVRKAYVDALMTWLERETTARDGIANRDNFDSSMASSKHKELPPARRVVSNTSQRERHAHHHQSQFLALLHVSIYDNALQVLDFDTDFVLLHSLLSKLVLKLGVNAARYGLPMVFRLQEEIQIVDQPIQKVRVAALCHGYFWALTERFKLEPTGVGRAIYNEISRRRQTGFWVEGVSIPPPTADQIGTPGCAGPQPAWDMSAVETGELLPFDDRTALVESIAGAYQDSVHSPPASPSVQPARRDTHSSFGANMSSIAETERDSELPSNYRMEMLGDWSREEAVAAIAAQAKPESISGSRTGTTGTHANRLTINTGGLSGNGHSTLPISPYGSLHNLRPLSAQPAADRLSTSKLRKSSIQSGASQEPSMSSKNGIASVDQLKMMLSGNASPRAVGIPGAGGGGDDDDSAESMLSYDYSLSEASFNPPSQQEQSTADVLRRTISASSKGTAPPASAGAERGIPEEYYGDDDVPPVPPLPNLSSFSGRNGLLGQGTLKSKRSVTSRGGESVRDKTRGRDSATKSLDLQELLSGIDSTSGEGTLGNVTRPPY
jgi:hypothetical protein